MYLHNLTQVQNFVQEISILNALLSNNKHYVPRPTKNAKRELEKWTVFEYNVTFIRNRLKLLHGRLNHLQQKILKDETGSSGNIKNCIFVFKSPLQVMLRSLKKVKLIERQLIKRKRINSTARHKYLKYHYHEIEAVLLKCKLSLSYFLKILHKYQNSLRFG